MSKKITRLKDIAEIAGVSVSAASKALKDSPEIGIETRNRIKEIAEVYGYQPNSSARSLRLGKTSRLGVILPGYTNVYNGMLQGIEDSAKANHYTTIVMNSQDNAEREQEALQSLLVMPVDGIISVPVSLEKYADIKVPTVFISRYPYREVPGVSQKHTEHCYVITDDYEGQRLAVQHMLSCCGSNHYILLGSSDLQSVAGIKEHIRLDSYRTELESSGIEYDASRVYFDATTLEAGYQIGMKICQTAKPPFGICATNDYVSIGVMHAVNACGLQVPKDVSIIGYDNFELCTYLNPSLSTVHCSKYSIGKYSVLQIMDTLNSNESNRVIQTILKPRLILRASTSRSDD
jgi:LacI family transcriptional regulator